MALSVSEATRAIELGAYASTSTGEPFGEWELPGMGEAGHRCGEVSASGFCDAHGHIEYQRHMCGRRGCPECWSSQWAKPRTVNVVSRLAAARHAHEAGIDRRVIHAVVSPDREINTIEGFYSARGEAVDVARAHGIRGGVTVAHGYRALDETAQRYREADPDLPLWWWIRENGRPWKEQVYWSPHFHVVGLARDLEAGDGEDGWVIQNLSTGKGVEPNPGLDRRFSPFEGLRDREAYNDMAGVVRYLLSHTTYPAGEDRQAVTWFGELHATNFCPDPAAAEERKTEPELGPLSAGAWDTIQRVAEEVVGADRDDEEEAEGGSRGELEECSVEGCEGKVHDIWSARMFLESPAAQRELTREERERVQVAYEWASGIVVPPPGLQRPQTIEHAEDVVEHLMKA